MDSLIQLLDDSKAISTPAKLRIGTAVHPAGYCRSAPPLNASPRIPVTLKLLQAKYACRSAEAGAPSMSYNRFCKRYRQYTASRNVVSRRST